MLDSRNDTDYLLGYDLDEDAAKRFEWKRWKQSLTKEHHSKSIERKKQDIDR